MDVLLMGTLASIFGIGLTGLKAKRDIQNTMLPVTERESKQMPLQRMHRMSN